MLAKRPYVPQFNLFKGYSTKHVTYHVEPQDEGIQQMSDIDRQRSKGATERFHLLLGQAVQFWKKESGLTDDQDGKEDGKNGKDKGVIFECWNGGKEFKRDRDEMREIIRNDAQVYNYIRAENWTDEQRSDLQRVLLGEKEEIYLDLDSFKQEVFWLRQQKNDSEKVWTKPEKKEYIARMRQLDFALCACPHDLETVLNAPLFPHKVSYPCKLHLYRFYLMPWKRYENKQVRDSMISMENYQNISPKLLKRVLKSHKGMYTIEGSLVRLQEAMNNFYRNEREKYLQEVSEEYLASLVTARKERDATIQHYAHQLRKVLNSFA